jgi:hypothetical protein
MELITGLAPMTQFDAASIPMYNAFHRIPNLTPYNVIKPAESILTQLNPANAPLASQMAQQNFSHEDMVPEQLLNSAIWQSVKGAGSPLPAPQYHVFAPDLRAPGQSTPTGGDN